MCLDSGLEISRADLLDQFFKRTGKNQVCSNRYTNVKDLIRRQDRQQDGLVGGRLTVICVVFRCFVFLFLFCFCVVLFLFCFVFCVCVCFFSFPFSVLGPAGQPAHVAEHKKRLKETDERNKVVPAAVPFVPC